MNYNIENSPSPKPHSSCLIYSLNALFPENLLIIFEVLDSALTQRHNSTPGSFFAVACTFLFLVLEWWLLTMEHPHWHPGQLDKVLRLEHLLDYDTIFYLMWFSSLSQQFKHEYDFLVFITFSGGLKRIFLSSTVCHCIEWITNVIMFGWTCIWIWTCL